MLCSESITYLFNCLFHYLLIKLNLLYNKKKEYVIKPNKECNSKLGQMNVYILIYINSKLII